MSRQAIPRAPAGLSAESRKLWRELHSAYDLQDATGLHWLTVALRAHDMMLEAQRTIQAEGATITGANGGPVRHPATLVYRDSSLQMERAFKMLNLAPERE